MTDIRISELPAVSSAGGVDVLPVVQSGVTKKASVTQINQVLKDELTPLINAKAPLESPALTGNPTAPTPTLGDNDTSIATTAFVNAEIAADTAHLAPLASPALTGTPTAPTAAVNTSTTQIATTAFVNAEVANDTAYLADFRSYVSSRTYAYNDPVFYLGVPYRSLSSGNTGNTPDTSPTYWEVTGGGSGAVNPGINYKNGQMDSSVNGYVSYKNAAQVTPVNGTGGSPGITFAYSAIAPIVGTGSGVLTKDTANRQGEGVSYDFTVDPGMRNQPLKITFNYLASSSYVDGDIGVYLYDITNATVLSPSIVGVPASGTSPGKFECSTWLNNNSGSYRLIFHIQSTSVLAYTFKVDNIQIQPLIPSLGAVISEWQSYTPAVFSGNGFTLTRAEYRRVGSSIELRGLLTYGSPITGSPAIGLPAGLYVVSSLNNEAIAMGTAIALDFGSNYFGNIDLRIPSGGNYFSFIGVSSTVPHTWAVNDTITYTASVPIAQWSANTNLVEDFTEYASYDQSTAIAPTGTVSGVYEEGINGSLFPNITAPILGAGYTSIPFRWKRPYQIGDLVLFEESPDNGATWRAVTNYLVDVAGSAYYGLFLVVNPGTSNGSVRFNYAGRKDAGVGLPSSFGGVGSPWDSLRSISFRWRVRKISNGNTAEVPPVVRAEYTGGSSAAGTIINYVTKVEDTHNAVTPGVGTWKFTAPISGIYSVEGMLYASVAENLFLIKNGVTFRNLKFGGVQMVDYSVSVRLLAGDYIGITSNSMSTNIADPWIVITRIGG
jgi:hypothetical protein